MNNLEKWKSFFSNEETYVFDAGHFVQEEEAKTTIEIMNSWLKEQ
jgi:hypothetical protein